MQEVPPTFIKALDESVEVHEQQPLVLECLVDSSPLCAAKWYKNNEEVKPDENVKFINEGDGTVKMEIAHIKPADSGAYKVVASNPFGEDQVMCAVAVQRKCLF